MPLSPQQAAETLGEIARTERRSNEAYCYAHSSPYFVMWGVIWIIGYTGSYLLPRYGLVQGINWLWFALSLIGIAGSIVMGRRQQRHADPAQRAVDRENGRRIGQSFVAIWIFCFCIFIVMRPVVPVATGAFFPLLAALAYALFGIWRGLRFLYVGILVAVLTIGGFVYLRDFYMLWMAFVGGTSLILVGFWLKKV